MTPVSLSKITPPQLTNTLPRPRLLNLLKKSMDKKLILILGQAAQGKSTLAASFLEQVPIPSAWVNLGPEESDPVNLFYALIDSLQQVLPEGDFSSLLEYPSRTMGPRDPAGFYREWVRGLAGFISSPIFLALDGLDRLISDSPAFSFLQILLEESPPELSLVLCSRQTPSAAFNYQPLKMQQQALVLNNKDLAFTRTEIRDFFSRTRRIVLKSQPLDKIRQATEGWIGGLILMAEILGRDLAADPDLFLRDGFLTRFRVEAFEYLGREIFAAQPPVVQDMLIRASLVPFVDPSLIRELSGGVDTEEILRKFARRNLFVQGIYEPGKGWIFRFHQLFREFLLNRFQEIFSEEERAAMYRKAASLFEKRGDLEAAGNLYLQAKDFEAVAGIIKMIGLDLFNKGRTEDLSGFLKVLPDEKIQQDPWLLLLLSLTRRWMEFPQNVARLERCLVHFEKGQDAKGVVLCLAFLIEAFMVVGLEWKTLRACLDKAEEWSAAPQLGKLPQWRAFLWLQVGFANMVRGNPYKGYQAFQQAYLLAKMLDNPILEVTILSHSLTNLTMLGDLTAAEEVYETLERLVGHLPYVESKIWYATAIIFYNTVIGNREKAFESIVEAKKIIAENGLSYFQMPMLLFEIIYLALLGDPKIAKTKGIENIGIAGSLGSKFYEGTMHHWLGISLYRAGVLDEAQEHLTKCIKIFSSGEGYSEVYKCSADIIRILIEHPRKDQEEIISDLENLLHYSQEINNFLFQTQAHLALALIQHDYGEETEAVEHLKTGFRIARDKGFRHFFFLSPGDSVQACLLVYELEVTEAQALARELLANRYAEHATPELMKLESHPSPRMRSLGLELLRIIHNRQVPFLEIKTLGGLQITRGESRVGEEGWTRHQPKRLLLALLCHPGGKVSKDVLIEELWPEEDADRGENNFKVNLMRLRKFLELDIHPTFGSSYVHLRNNMVFLNPEFARTDVDEFLIAVDRGRWKDRAQDARGALEEYGKALEYYLGDFLPLENSLPGVDRRRDELRRIFIETLLRLAKLSEEQGSLKKAAGYYRRILDADPLQEGACRAFMRLSLSLSNFNEALRVFETLRKNLRQELKSRPDPQTLALYNRIRSVFRIE